MHSGSLENFCAVFPGDRSRSFLAAYSFVRGNKNSGPRNRLLASTEQLMDARSKWICGQDRLIPGPNLERRVKGDLPPSWKGS